MVRRVVFAALPINVTTRALLITSEIPLSLDITVVGVNVLQLKHNLSPEEILPCNDLLLRLLCPDMPQLQGQCELQSRSPLQFLERTPSHSRDQKFPVPLHVVFNQQDGQI